MAKANVTVEIVGLDELRSLVERLEAARASISGEEIVRAIRKYERHNARTLLLKG